MLEPLLGHWATGASTPRGSTKQRRDVAESISEEESTAFMWRMEWKWVTAKVRRLWLLRLSGGS